MTEYGLRDAHTLDERLELYEESKQKAQNNKQERYNDFFWDDVHFQKEVLKLHHGVNLEPQAQSGGACTRLTRTY